MSVTAYAGDALESKIERLCLKAGFLEEWDEERAETAVYV
jgi:hypothetical protein